MNAFIKRIAALLLIAIFFFAQLSKIATAQETRERRTPEDKSDNSRWPSDSSSVVKQTTEGIATASLSNEPVMRIALSTGTSAATISANARLVTVSEFNDASQPLETTRVRVESR